MSLQAPQSKEKRKSWYDKLKSFAKATAVEEKNPLQWNSTLTANTELDPVRLRVVARVLLCAHVCVSRVYVLCLLST